MNGDMRGVWGAKPPTGYFDPHKSSTPINLAQIVPMLVGTI